MWTEDPPSFEGEYDSITGAAAPPLPEVVRAAEGAGRDPGSIQTGITIERPLPETDAESPRRSTRSPSGERPASTTS